MREGELKINSTHTPQ